MWLGVAAAGGVVSVAAAGCVVGVAAAMCFGVVWV